MADYYAKTRSNDFKVKDEAAFRRWAASRELSVWNEKKDSEDYFRIYIDISDGGGWPTFTGDGEGSELIELDFPGELAEHLQDGSVAVLMDIGFERLRYLQGNAIAVNSKGETVTLELENIFELAKHLGSEITRINE